MQNNLDLFKPKMQPAHFRLSSKCSKNVKCTNFNLSSYFLSVLRDIENDAYAKMRRDNKVYYGIFIMV